MRVVRSLSELREPLARSAVTIGNFDGIHRAHRTLLERVVRSARETGGKALVVTFDPHPARILAPERAPRMLTPLDAKVALIARENIDVLIVLPFNQELARLSPGEFVQQILVGKLGVAVVHVGSNFRFGHQRSGDTGTLVEIGKQSGFRVEALPMLTLRGEPVSSSRIRQLLAEGRVDIAGRMLGRPFSVAGPIVSGEGVGRSQTVPTLNLAPVEQQLPQNGVYITRTRLGGTLYESVTNVGEKPTFGPHPVTVECFLLNFSGKVDAGKMEVMFLHRLRDEIKFPNPEALKKQIQNDVRCSLKYFRLLKVLVGPDSHQTTSTTIRA
jgi:riboflavin kinase / FMN adenylyltransferase